MTRKLGMNWEITAQQDWLSPVYSGRLEIHSTHPGALMHYSGLEFHFKVKSRVQRAIQIPVRQSRVTLVTERPQKLKPETLLYLSDDNTWSFTLSAYRSFETKDYLTFSHCFYRVSFCFRVYMLPRTKRPDCKIGKTKKLQKTHRVYSMPFGPEGKFCPRLNTMLQQKQCPKPCGIQIFAVKNFIPLGMAMSICPFHDFRSITMRDLVISTLSAIFYKVFDQKME